VITKLHRLYTTSAFGKVRPCNEIS